MGDRVFQELISLNEAAERGILRVRQPNWANRLDYLQLDVVDGKPGPWFRLYAPFNQECNGRYPVVLSIFELSVNVSKCCFEPYAGPLFTSAEYQTEAAKFTGVLGDHNG